MVRRSGYTDLMFIELYSILYFLGVEVPKVFFGVEQVIELTLVLFHFFIHMYNYAIIDSGYHEAFSYVGRFDLGDT